MTKILLLDIICSNCFADWISCLAFYDQLVTLALAWVSDAFFLPATEWAVSWVHVLALGENSIRPDKADAWQLKFQNCGENGARYNFWTFEPVGDIVTYVKSFRNAFVLRQTIFETCKNYHLL